MPTGKDPQHLPRSIAEAHALLQNRSLKPSELLELQVEAIRRCEPEVLAWASLDIDGARERARQLDRQWEAGRGVHPLFAIPYGAKDIIETRAFPTEAGSSLLRGWRPKADATVIRRLEEGGSILLGKTTATEFAQPGGRPPRTTNPWNVGHTPGGSSNGSAAAVAAGMAFFALGTQTAGSLSRPAGYCGLTALKGTFGRISKSGVLASAWTIDHVGALTRSVEDTVLVFNVLAGKDPDDEFTLGLPPISLQPRAHASHRIGVVRHPFFSEPASPPVRQAVESATQTLGRLGARVIDVSLPEGLEEATAANHLILQAEAAAIHASWFEKHPDQYPPALVDFIDNGRSHSATSYLEAQRVRALYRRKFLSCFEDVDVMVTPTSPTTAPAGLDFIGSPVFNLPFSSLGVPTLALPVGFDDAGLPCSMQMIAPLCEEQRLVDVGMAYQQETDWHRRAPGA